MRIVAQNHPKGSQELTHAISGATIGYRISGGTAGPRALAVGRRQDAQDAFERLALLESLPRLRGELFVLFEDAVDDETSGIAEARLLDTRFDGKIFIAYQDVLPADSAAQRDQDRAAYWTVLRLCARLGMISGRGVPKSTFGLSRQILAQKTFVSAGLVA